MVAKKSSPTKGTAAKGNNNSEAKVDAAPEPKQPKTRIVIADDHAVLRESLAALLSTQQDFSVEGTAADGMQALELVQKVHPDVLVLDLFMPGSDGFEVLRTLDKAGSRVATVVLTGSES